MIIPLKTHTHPETPHQEEPAEVTEYSKMVDKLYTDITVTFHKYRATPLNECMKQQKFDQSGDRDNHLKAAKEAVQRIQQDIDGPLSVDDYNTLLYATVLTLTGPVLDTPPKEEHKNVMTPLTKNTKALAYSK